MGSEIFSENPKGFKIPEFGIWMGFPAEKSPLVIKCIKSLCGENFASYGFDPKFGLLNFLNNSDIAIDGDHNGQSKANQTESRPINLFAQKLRLFANIEMIFHRMKLFYLQD